jgi:cold shock CspA family protein
MDKVFGVVRRVRDAYGFISSPDGKEYFFHWTHLGEKSKPFTELRMGDKVYFTPVEVEGRPRATNIETM